MADPLTTHNQRYMKRVLLCIERQNKCQKISSCRPNQLVQPMGQIALSSRSLLFLVRLKKRSPVLLLRHAPSKEGHIRRARGSAFLVRSWSVEMMDGLIQEETAKKVGDRAGRISRTSRAG